MRHGTALVGLGAIAMSAHLPALSRSAGIRLLAVADTDPRRRDAAAAVVPPDVDVLTTLDEVLALPELEGVVLATPPWATSALAVQAAAAGRFVLAEKPIATDPEAAGVFTELGAAARRRIQVGLSYRHDPAMSALRDLVRSGTLGSPLVVRAHIYDEVRTADEAHSDLILRTLSHGSPAIHEGAHVMDGLRWILGEDPVIEDGWSVRTSPELPETNIVGARARYGAHQALVEFGWFTAGLPRCELTITGEGGTAVLDLVTYTLEVHGRSGTDVIAFPGDRVARSFDLQVQRFVMLMEGAEAEPSLDDGLAALHDSYAIDRQAHGVAP